MIATLDIETLGLNAQAYVIGCLYYNNKPHFYNTPQELYTAVIKLGIKSARAGSVLTLYSHNAAYDTAGYINIEDKHLHFFSHQPFIWEYRLTKQEYNQHHINCPKTSKAIIKFLDTMSIYKMSLEKIGTMLNLPKGKTPTCLIEARTPTPQELEEIKTYLEQDCHINYSTNSAHNKKHNTSSTTNKQKKYTNQHTPKKYTKHTEEEESLAGNQENTVSAYSTSTVSTHTASQPCAYLICEQKEN